MEKRIATVQERLARAERVLVLTGAGVSAESGVPTFRGPGGLWKQFDATQLATPEAFQRDPEFVWEWYNERRANIAECKPNPAHYAIAHLERMVPEFLLVTQNIDGLHRLAGSRRIAEMHGSIWNLRPVDAEQPVIENRDVPIRQIPPRDGDGHLLRPAIVWFGEMLPHGPLEMVESFLEFPPDIIIVAGTSSLVTWVPYLVMRTHEQGAFVVEVNIQRTELSGLADVRIKGKAGDVLPQMVAKLEQPK